VEAGKKAAAEVLALQVRLEALLSDGNSITLEELASTLGLSSPEPLFCARCQLRRRVASIT
jgi:glucose-6-phosphate isomerase